MHEFPSQCDDIRAIRANRKKGIPWGTWAHAQGRKGLADDQACADHHVLLVSMATPVRRRGLKPGASYQPKLRRPIAIDGCGSEAAGRGNWNANEAVRAGAGAVRGAGDCPVAIAPAYCRSGVSHRIDEALAASLR
jgi:hypothetical protein